MLIDIRQVLKQKAPAFSRKIPGFIVDYLIRTVHQDELNDILYRYRDKEGVAFMQELIRYFDLKLEVAGAELPTTDGRYVFVSNHPLGGLDGICLSALIGERFEGKIRYLVNDLLMYIPNLRSIFVPVNKYGVQGRENACLIEQAYASENQIVTFPAGFCSRRINGKIQDIVWTHSFVRKAVEYQRDVVPVYFDGANSSFFYRIARWRKVLGIRMNYELIYLPDEMFKSKHKTFRVYFGEPIPWQTFTAEKNSHEWAEWVRTCVYNLKKK